MSAENSGNAGYRSVWQDLRQTAFQQAWRSVAGVGTRYWQAGSSGGDVVLLHGTGGHLEAFARNLRALADRYRTWALDMPGHGWSDLAEHDLEIDDYVAHLLAFLDEAGIGQAALVGVSLGGWVASRFAVLHPDRVSALVLVTTGGSQADRKVMTTIRSTTSAAVDQLGWASVRARLEYLVHDPATIPDDLVATRLAIYGRDGMSENMRHVLALQDQQIRQRNIIPAADYARIAAPTLVLWTEHDPTAPVAEGRRIASLIGGSEFVVFDDCAHWPQFERPEEFNRLVLDFLKRRLPETDREEMRP